MKLDRNLNAEGRGKYGLIKNRKIAEIDKNWPAASGPIRFALSVLESYGVLDWGTTPETEFFVMRLRDVHAGAALEAYAQDAHDRGCDADYTNDVKMLADRAGVRHPHFKVPD